MSKRTTFNPFYALLLLAGCAFAVTACAYGVMTVRRLHHLRAGVSDADSFTQQVDQYGATAMTVELIVLAIGTAGAIGYDQHLDKKLALRQGGLEDSPEEPS